MITIELEREQICCILLMLERYDNWDEASEMLGADLGELDSVLRAALEAEKEPSIH